MIPFKILILFYQQILVKHRMEQVFFPYSSNLTLLSVYLFIFWQVNIHLKGKVRIREWHRKKQDGAAWQLKKWDLLVLWWIEISLE